MMDAPLEPPSTLTVFCLPYAGGSASVYRDWAARLPPWITLVPLHMPARGIRHGMPAIHLWPDLIDLLLADVQRDVTRPFAIFGHSLGGLVGIELAYAIRDRLGRSPVWLGASACRAPSHRVQRHDWLTCPEETFIDQVRAMNGMPEALLQNREFMEMVLPYLRADFHLSGSYAYPPGGRGTPLTCPIAVINGQQDREIVGDPQNVSAWSIETRGAVTQHELDAGHFFINTHREALIDLMVDSLAAVFHSRWPSSKSPVRAHA